MQEQTSQDFQQQLKDIQKAYISSGNIDQPFEQNLSTLQEIQNKITDQNSQWYLLNQLLIIETLFYLKKHEEAEKIVDEQLNTRNRKNQRLNFFKGLFMENKVELKHEKLNSLMFYRKCRLSKKQKHDNIVDENNFFYALICLCKQFQLMYFGDEQEEMANILNSLFNEHKNQLKGYFHLLEHTFLCCRFGDKNGATQIYKEYIKNEENDKRYLAYSYLALIYRREHNNEKCLECIDKCLELQPNFGLAYFQRALVHAFSGQTEQAREWFDKCIEADPQLPNSYVQGQSFNVWEDDEEEVVRKGVQNCPFNFQICYLMCQAYLRHENKYQEQIDIYEKFLEYEFNQDNYKIYQQLGILYKLNNQISQSIKNFALADYYCPNADYKYHHENPKLQKIIDYLVVIKSISENTKRRIPFQLFQIHKSKIRILFRKEIKNEIGQYLAYDSLSKKKFDTLSKSKVQQAFQYFNNIFGGYGNPQQQNIYYHSDEDTEEEEENQNEKQENENDDEEQWEDEGDWENEN